eukprot:TRINITY_DN46778_c0_g1_i1.p1 TRINITY_DN46778_c0_g1~~TRINITY_DN46778_c0_g1_i1.p1  ORF type:complete len:1427 (+),score=326.43 TRINITY_DN46778_c0_g1_i1:78-4358(+)
MESREVSTRSSYSSYGPFKAISHIGLGPRIRGSTGSASGADDRQFSAFSGDSDRQWTLYSIGTTQSVRQLGLPPASVVSGAPLPPQHPGMAALGLRARTYHPSEDGDATADGLPARQATSPPARRRQRPSHLGALNTPDPAHLVGGAPLRAPPFGPRPPARPSRADEGQLGGTLAAAASAALALATAVCGVVCRAVPFNPTVWYPRRASARSSVPSPAAFGDRPDFPAGGSDPVGRSAAQQRQPACVPMRDFLSRAMPASPRQAQTARTASPLHALQLLRPFRTPRRSGGSLFAQSGELPAASRRSWVGSSAGRTAPMSRASQVWGRRQSRPTGRPSTASAAPGTTLRPLMHAPPGELADGTEDLVWPIPESPLASAGPTLVLPSTAGGPGPPVISYPPTALEGAPVTEVPAPALPAPPSGETLSVHEHIARRREWTHTLTGLLQKKLLEHAHALRKAYGLTETATGSGDVGVAELLSPSAFRLQPDAASPGGRPGDANTQLCTPDNEQLSERIAAERGRLKQAETDAYDEYGLTSKDFAAVSAAASSHSSDSQEGAIHQRCVEMEKRIQGVRMEVRESSRRLMLLIEAMQVQDSARQALEHQLQGLTRKPGEEVHQATKRRKGDEIVLKNGRQTLPRRISVQRKQANVVPSGRPELTSPEPGQTMQGPAKERGQGAQSAPWSPTAWTVSEVAVLARMPSGRDMSATRTEREDADAPPETPLTPLPELPHGGIAVAWSEPGGGDSSGRRTDSVICGGDQLLGLSSTEAAEIGRGAGPLKRSCDPVPFHNARMERLDGTVGRVREVKQSLEEVVQELEEALMRRWQERSERIVALLEKDAEEVRWPQGAEEGAVPLSQLDFAEAALMQAGVAKLASLQSLDAQQDLPTWHPGDDYPGRADWEVAEPADPALRPMPKVHCYWGGKAEDLSMTTQSAARRSARRLKSQKVGTVQNGDRCLVRDGEEDPWILAVIHANTAGSIFVVPEAPPDARLWPDGQRTRRFRYLRRVPQAAFHPGPWSPPGGPVARDAEDEADAKALTEATLVQQRVREAQSALSVQKAKQAEKLRLREFQLLTREAELDALQEDYKRRLNDAEFRKIRLQDKHTQLLTEQLRAETEVTSYRQQLTQLEEEIAGLKPGKVKGKKRHEGAASPPKDPPALVVCPASPPTTAAAATREGPSASPRLTVPGASEWGGSSDTRSPGILSTFTAFDASSPFNATPNRESPGGAFGMRLSVAPNSAFAPRQSLMRPLRMDAREAGTPSGAPAAAVEQATYEVGIQNDIEMEMGLHSPGNDRACLARRERELRSEIANLRDSIGKLIEFNCELEAEITCKHCVHLCDQPRMMWPCGHTACSRCADSMRVGDEEAWRCAECGGLSIDGHIPNHFLAQLCAKWRFKESGYHDLSLAIAAFAQEMDDIDQEIGAWR